MHCQRIRTNQKEVQEWNRQNLLLIYGWRERGSVISANMSVWVSMWNVCALFGGFGGFCTSKLGNRGSTFRENEKYEVFEEIRHRCSLSLGFLMVGKKPTPYTVLVYEG
ncbi:hypothetical protein ASG85_10995 [Paenibacillus sp. Soil724D2]|nr:hypothetical protein ASG85_10995 [Paenibacillus sp. Soil724D2]